MENWWKGRRMRYKKAVIGMMAVCAVLGGCRRADEEPKTAAASGAVSQEKSEDTVETENTMDFSSMKNGDRIRRKITDEVTMDAELVLPEKSLDSVGICHVLLDNYDGPKVMEDLLGYIPENVEKTSYSENDNSYLYRGNLGTEFADQEGSFAIAKQIYLTTDHWNSMSQIMPMMRIGYDIKLWNEECKAQAEQNLPFQTREGAEQEICQTLSEKTEGKIYHTLRMYSFSHQILEERQNEYIVSEENQAKPIDNPRTEWGETEDCYWLQLEQELEGIPILSHSVMRSDDLYVPSQEITVGYTKNGIEYLSILEHYTIQEEEKVTLESYETIENALKKKFEMMFAGNVEITQMKLIYFPLCTEQDADRFWKCDMIPTWEFTIQTGMGTDYVYINAVDGMEIYG